MPQHEPPSKPGHTPGYPEKQPGDKDEARQPGPRKPRNPDEGGLGRDGEQDGKPDAA